MKTSFTLQQLADPAIADADAILRSCEHFGFCTAGCPTYVLLGDENDAPRGRIDLIREMLEDGGAPKPKTVAHLDRCLSCMSCMTTCAIRVDYRHLIDRARAHVETHHRRPWDERLVRALLAAVLPHPSRFRVALALAPIGRRALALAPAGLAARLRPLLALAPATPPAPEPRVPGEHPATAPRRGRVLLLAGWAQRVLAPSINAATIRMLNRAGFDVTVPPEAGCCGSLELHMGREAPAMAAARATVRAWTAELGRGEVAAIVVNASGCGSTVKDYGHLLKRDPVLADAAARIGTLARDACEFLAEVGLPDAPQPRRHVAAIHDPCSLRNVQRVTDAPRALLAGAGFVLREIPEAHFCCGSAGTYNLLEPEIARRLGERKAAHVAGTGAQLVAAANVGCVVQIGAHSSLPVVHPVELLDWAWGGPRPAALEGVVLDEVAAPVAAHTASGDASATGPAGAPPSPADGGGASSGFW